MAKEIKPTFLFLENVSAIRTRGLDRVIEEITEIGYDCRWCMLSASDVGANHKRERWFCLARHTKGYRSDKDREISEGETSITGRVCPNVAHSQQQRLERGEKETNRREPYERDHLRNGSDTGRENVADPSSERIWQDTGTVRGEQDQRDEAGWDGIVDSSPEVADTYRGRRNRLSGERSIKSDMGGVVDGLSSIVVEGLPDYLTRDYWQEEPEDISRVTEEKEQRVERIKRLGNAVVPLQLRTAFEYLMGLQQPKIPDEKQNTQEYEYASGWE